MSKKHLVSPEQAEELIDRLYKETSNEEPDASLDESILAQARKSAEEAPRSAARQKIYWHRYGSIAATLVIAVTIGMIYTDNQEVLSPEAPIVIQSREAAKEQVPVERSKLEADGFSQQDLEDSAVSADIREEVLQEERRTQTAIPSKSKKASSEPMGMSSGYEAMSTADDASELAPSPKPAPSARTLMAPKSMMKAAPEPETLSAQLLVENIREAVEKDDQVKADQLWKKLQDQYPDYPLPEDLVTFFRDNNQVGEADKVERDATTNQDQ